MDEQLKSRLRRFWNIMPESSRSSERLVAALALGEVQLASDIDRPRRLVHFDATVMSSLSPSTPRTPSCFATPSRTLFERCALAFNGRSSAIVPARMTERSLSSKA
jgi:hypothetical protein